jgi:hypothetical protein
VLRAGEDHVVIEIGDHHLAPIERWSVNKVGSSLGSFYRAVELSQRVIITCWVMLCTAFVVFRGVVLKNARD